MFRCDECIHKDECVGVPMGCECYELDMVEHDAKVRTEAIDEVAHALLDCNDKLTRSIVRRILEQMKGESNEDKNL